MNPFIDKSLNEKFENEFSIHGLTIKQLESLLDAIDLKAANCKIDKQKQHLLNLSDCLNKSFNETI